MAKLKVNTVDVVRGRLQVARFGPVAVTGECQVSGSQPSIANMHDVFSHHGSNASEQPFGDSLEMVVDIHTSVILG
jgi:hypothetical protein